MSEDEWADLRALVSGDIEALDACGPPAAGDCQYYDPWLLSALLAERDQLAEAMNLLARNCFINETSAGGLRVYERGCGCCSDDATDVPAHLVELIRSTGQAD